MKSFSDIKKQVLSKKTLLSVMKFTGVVFGFLTTIALISRPYLNEFVDSKIAEHDKKVAEEQAKKVPLRNLLGDAMHVHKDMVPFHIAKKFAELDSLISDINKFSDELLPHLEKEVNWIYPRLMINPDTGEQWWWHKDGKAPYRVVYRKGRGYIWYHGDWVAIFT
jgi:hypothetical protein